MRWFVVIPGSLVPAPFAADVLGSAQVEQLCAWLARADRAADETVHDAAINATHVAWLWRAFCGRGTVPVTAPYAWRALSHASVVLPDDGSQWWHCDPIHVEVARDHLMVGRSEDALLTETEADGLAAEADAVLREHDALLKRVRHDAWFVQTDTVWRLDTAPLVTARGQSMGPCLPIGADAARWRRILTEIQMRWHDHAVNLAREQRGQQPVNGVWLHGGGEWAPLPRSPFVAIASDDAVLRGWGLAAGLPPSALIRETDSPPRHGDVVSLWPELLEPAVFESWAVWLGRLAAVQSRLGQLRQHALATGAESIELVLTGRQVTRIFSLRRRDHLRFWRGVARRSLAEMLAEPVA